MKSTIRHGLLLLALLLLGGCGFFDNDQLDMPYKLNPDAFCANSSSDEWTLLGLREKSVLSILVHPQNPQVIFAGTGFDFSAQRDGKIFRSIDCGTNWEKVYEGGSFRGLLFHPNDPYTLFAWHHRPTGGLLRSTDGGDTWKMHSDGMNTDGGNLTSVMIIHPNNPQIMYASTAGRGSGSLYKSINGGNKWVNITMTHWPHLGSGATAIFMHPYQPELLLYSSDFHGTLIRSTDGGDTWEDVLFGSRRVMAFAMNPANPDQIVGAMSRVGMLVSQDRGKTWQVNEILPEPEGSSLLIRDAKYLNNNMYIATYRGVLLTNDLKNYSQLGSRILGTSKGGNTVYFPEDVRVMASDLLQQNLYIGHRLMLFEDELFGGVYVRKLDH